MLRRGGAMTLFFKGVQAREWGRGWACTRQKEKSKKWRVRSRPTQSKITALHTSKRKKQEMTCAEAPTQSRAA